MPSQFPAAKPGPAERPSDIPDSDPILLHPGSLDRLQEVNSSSKLSPPIPLPPLLPHLLRNILQCVQPFDPRQDRNGLPVTLPPRNHP